MCSSEHVSPTCLASSVHNRLPRSLMFVTPRQLLTTVSIFVVFFEGFGSTKQNNATTTTTSNVPYFGSPIPHGTHYYCNDGLRYSFPWKCMVTLHNTIVWDQTPLPQLQLICKSSDCSSFCIKDMFPYYVRCPPSSKL